MKAVALILLMLSVTQNNSFELQKSIEGNFSSVKLDEVGNVYLINAKKNLVKLNDNLDSLYTFESKSMEVDVVAPQNSLKTLIHNRNLNTVLFLDKTLTPTSGEVELDAVNLPLVKAIGVSRDNNIWVFDDNEQELKKYNSSLEQVYSSGNLMNITGESWYPYSLVENEDKVYASDSTQGILEFDLYGSFLRVIPYKIKGSFYVVDNNLLYLKSDSLVVKDLLLKDEKKVGLPIRGITDFAYSKDRIYLLSKEKLHIYTLPL